MQQQPSYKVIFHVGESISLGTKGQTGRLSLDNEQLSIHGELDLVIPHKAIRSVELFRLHQTGRMLKIVHNGGVLFVSVFRFSFFGVFAITNFFGTGRLNEELQSIIWNEPRE